MRCLALLVLLMLSLAAVAEPEVRVRTSLVPADPVMVGGTVQLQVDLLVDTWFSTPPQLPKLELDGAMVSAPSGEATHLTERLDGKTFFGLRYIYRIAPQRAQSFDIPALAIEVNPGQGSGPQKVSSQPQSFVARQVAGAEGQQRLVAQKVEFTQQIVRSHDPLRVGDSVTRRLSVRAEGGEAMLIPPPAFAPVDGLKRYVQTPAVQPLGDGRGGVIGGSRDDAATYVVAESGRFRLPAIELQWWDAGTGQAHRLSVPEVAFEATAAAGYQAPFSITDDLRALGRKARVHIAGHWLVLAVVLLGGGLAWHFGRPWMERLLDAWRQWRQRRRQAWLDSADFAWRQAGEQLAVRPPRLDGLYLWIRRSTGSRNLLSHFQPFSVEISERLLAFFRTCYGMGQRREDAPAELAKTLPELRQAVVEQRTDSRSRKGLKSLNPRGR
ncbi:BatD family protein [Pseudomonas schmalbachii]|uniref:BatD family protein n=1 Tax=Pseudomonas schmalbachii TaxID=2816993 RepID=A0ABS3TMN0_9PSED|nr:BatD family protein [Pseudomonas schmalbachii]MBO3273839.1 BatD family protein [Pseudomonas schmalbachii]